MPLDATYDQLLRMLATRALGWFRQRIEALPDPLPLSHPAATDLARAARLAPVLTGLRGHPSPLQDLIARRLGPRQACEAASRLLADQGPQDAATIAMVLAGGSVGGGHPLWRLAQAHLADLPPADLAERMAVTVVFDAGLRNEIEHLLITPIPDESLTEARIDLFARVLMQMFEFGARRPVLSHSRIFGDAFANCLRFADWAQRRGRLTPMAQMAFCLRLIDPDHDASSLMSVVIGHQRPDGSFPATASYGTRDQDLPSGSWSTLMALLALHQGAYRRTRFKLPVPRIADPLHAIRDRMAGLIAEALPACLDELSAECRLLAATSLTRATGENWFNRAGLAGHAPDIGELKRLAPRIFGSFAAARHARTTLNLGPAWHQLADTAAVSGISPHLQRSLDWLRGATVSVGHAIPPTLLDDWNAASLRGDIQGFHRCCEEAAAHVATSCPPPIRALARQIARTDLIALEAPDADTSFEQQLTRLDRLCLMVQILEPGGAMGAAA